MKMSEFTVSGALCERIEVGAFIAEPSDARVHGMCGVGVGCAGGGGQCGVGVRCAGQ